MCRKQDHQITEKVKLLLISEAIFEKIKPGIYTNFVLMNGVLEYQNVI